MCIIEAVALLDLEGEEFNELVPLLKSILWIKCDYTATKSAEDLAHQALLQKFRMSESFRPDVFQILKVLSTAILSSCQQGGAPTVTKASMKLALEKFNTNSQVQGLQVTDLEYACTVLVSGQSLRFKDLLSQHWHNFKAKESAVPMKAASMGKLKQGMRQDSKSRGCAQRDAELDVVRIWARTSRPFAFHRWRVGPFRVSGCLWSWKFASRGHLRFLPPWTLLEILCPPVPPCPPPPPRFWRTTKTLTCRSLVRLGSGQTYTAPVLRRTSTACSATSTPTSKGGRSTVCGTTKSPIHCAVACTPAPKLGRGRFIPAWVRARRGVAIFPKSPHPPRDHFLTDCGDKKQKQQNTP